MKHIGTGSPWDFIGRIRGAKILPPRTGQQDSDWYKGTADAVRQNIDFIESNSPDRILILSGDHIYKMDYSQLIEFHNKNKADLTIGMMPVPWEDTGHFGIAITDEQNRIVEWEEKPEKARNNLASMGIYVFNTKYLLSTLRSHREHDFGKNIIPAAVILDKVCAYPFEGYWRDVGTLKAYWEANMDLLDADSGLDLQSWGLRTNVEEEGILADRPPTFIGSDSVIKNSIISPGCHIEGRVENSILAPGVKVEKGAMITDSVVMNETRVGAGAKVLSCILDKNATIGEKAFLGAGSAEVANIETPGHLSNGLIVVGKGTHVPANFQISKNSILYPHLQESDFPSSEIPEGETIRPARFEE
jgi:glucose-1-phosphate adenylyltransferase